MHTTRLTSATPDELWPILSDLRRWPEWLPTVDAAEPVAPGAPDGVGTAYDLRQPRLPRARWTVTDWRPGAGFTWESHAPGVTSVGRHELRPTADGTEIALAIDWSGPLAWLIRLGYGRLTRRYLETEAAALAARAESAHPAGS